MMVSLDLTHWLTIWTVTAGFILLSRTRNKSVGVGLVAAYVFNMVLLYWVAGVIYLLPWYLQTFDPATVAVGIQQSTYALIGFGIGAVFIAPRFNKTTLRRPVVPGLGDPRLAHAYMVIGLVCYLVLQPLAGRIPSGVSLASQGWNLLITGLCLACWYAWRKTNHRDFGMWLVITTVLPVLTVVTQGFFGAGMAVIIGVFTFLTSFYRPRWHMFLLALIIGYVGLSLYVTYMRDRTDIREVVWGGQALSARVARVYETFSNFEWFDPHNQNHLFRIDERMNMADQAGAAVQYVDSGLAPFAHGRTLLDAVLAIIPRAIWPTKPIVAGGSDIVSQYTGQQFAGGTSVGVGSVMEAYINFGTFGVVLMHMIVGTLIGAIDTAAGLRLRNDDWPGFLSRFLPGLALVPVGGSFLELTSSATAALVAATIVNRALARRWRLSPRTNVPPGNRSAAARRPHAATAGVARGPGTTYVRRLRRPV